MAPALVFALWTVLLLVSAGQLSLYRAGGPDAIPFGRALLLQLPIWYFWALATPLVLRLGDRFALERGRVARHLPIHFAVACLLTLVHAVVIIAVYRRVLPQPMPVAPLRAVLGAAAQRLPVDLVTYWAIVGTGFALRARARLQARALESAQLSAQLAQAELRALNMQLQPHFLFNTLHTIGVLVRQRPEAAMRMVTLLGDLLRDTLAAQGANLVPLREDLATLHAYLEIEAFRFQDRLTVAVRVDDDVLAVSVPHLLLQPLVENALRHGLAPKPGPGRLDVRGARRGESLVLEIRDDGIGPSPAPLTEGVGLRTTRARLERLYGSAATLTWNAPPGGGFSVTANRA